jgi:hypothetical protein
VSKLLRDAFFNRLEDEYDMRAVSEYQAMKPHVNHDWDDVKKELDFE